jgi:hypothetical protein
MVSISDLTGAELFAFVRRLDDAYESEVVGRNALMRLTTKEHDPQQWSRFLRTDPVAVCLMGNEHVEKLIAFLNRKAKSAGESSLFARPDAIRCLLSAICSGLMIFNHYTLRGKKPETITIGLIPSGYPESSSPRMQMLFASGASELRQRNASAISPDARGGTTRSLGSEAAMFPDTRPQALLDKLVITALSALAHKHWRAPYLSGRNRDRWKLPHDLSRRSA